MHTSHQNQLQSLLDQNAVFQQLVHQKLNHVLIDTEKTAIASLSALKIAADYIKNQLSLDPVQEDELISMFIEMQTTFQFQDVIRQTIERLQDAMQTRDELLMNLPSAVSNPQEIELLSTQMQKIISKYNELEDQHISSVHLKNVDTSDKNGVHIELF
jgi:hypothetical protein